MPVHIYGHPVDMDPLLKLAEEFGLKIIEDTAEAHGAQYLSRYNDPRGEWKRCGSFGGMSCFSFYANKLVTTGEGGMFLTDDPLLAEKARSLRNLCFQPRRRFYHEALGFNFRMTNLQAALGVAQLERMDEIVAHKRWMGQAYTERLQDIACLQIPIEKPWARNVYWMYGLVVSEETGLDAVEFARRLHSRGIETRPFFLGMHEQPVLRNMGLFKDESYPVTDRIARQGLYIPSGMALNAEQLEKVTQAIHEVLI
jgi:perosamine synthetase